MRARQIFGMAANRNYAPAETQLAEMLLRGHGGPVDEEGAIRLFESASHKDYGPALLSSAKLYRDGAIIERDAKKAYERGRRAAELGIEESIDIEPSLLTEYCQSTDVTCVSVRVLYMTDREDTGSENLDTRFANEREDLFFQHSGDNPNLHYGLVTVTVPARVGTRPGHIGTRQRMVNWLSDRVFGFNVYDVSMVREIVPLTEIDFGTILRELLELSEPRRVMVFAHGFNNSFSFAARRFAEFVNHIDFDGIPIMFSWPSKNQLSRAAYTADFGQVMKSCNSFSAALDTIERYGQSTRVDVLVHSMGAKLLFFSVAGGEGSWCESSNLRLSDVVLAAPDIDKNLFLGGIVHFTNRMSSVTMYASSNDRALNVSSTIAWGGEHRLGQGGTEIAVDGNMYSIDATGVERQESEDIARHAYVFANDVVVRDVQELLMENRLPGERECPVARHRAGLTYWVFDPNVSEQCRSN